MCAETDEEALEKASGWTFFIFALSRYGRKGIDAPGKSDLWAEYQDWRHTEKAQQALRNGLIGSPETRSEEHTSELQSLMRSSYAVFCLQKKKHPYQRRLA